MRKHIKTKKYKLLFSLYFFFMTILYLGYIFLENYRINLAEKYQVKSTIIPAEIERISFFGSMITSIELIFLFLFLAVSIYCLFMERKDKKILKIFLGLNIFFYFGILVLSIFLSTFRFLPVGNLLQPLIIPFYFYIGLLIYFVWVSKNKRGTV